MKVHELAIFWRSATTRCFTSWHFLPGSQERAAHRATQMLALLAKLSQLQIYGAALDGEPRLPAAAKPAPARGTEIRLQVDLYPAKPLNPKAGLTYIKFSIPGPIQAVIDLVESQRFQHRDWQALKKEVFPYLCLPDGTQQKQAGSALYRAEIAYLDRQHEPQPDYPPLAAAIERTTEDLNIARASFNKLKTEQEKQRVEKYQKRLDTLYTWEYLEKDLFDQRENLPLLQAESIEAPALEVAESEIAESLPLANLTSALKAAVIAAQPSHLPVPIEPAPTTPTPPGAASNNRFNGQVDQKEEAITMTDTTAPHAIEPEAYLPVLPAASQAHAWQDVPPAQFQDAAMWLDRNLIKEKYKLSERSFFRWIDTLRQYGLQRWLPAQGKPLLRLYYRPDLETAVQNYQTATSTAPLQGRPRKLSATASQQQTDTATSAPVPSARQAEIHLQQPAPGIAPMAAHPDLAPQSALPTTLEISHLAAALLEVQARCTSLEKTVVELQQRYDSLTEQLQHQAQVQQQAGKDEILAAISKLARKLSRRAAAPAPATRKARPASARTSAAAIKKSKKDRSRPQQKRKAVSSKVKAKAAPAHNKRSAKKTR